MHFFTSDEFEDESMQNFLRLFPTFTSFAVNGQSITPSLTLSPHSPRNLVRYDLDIRLIPTNQEVRRGYKWECVMALMVQSRLQSHGDPPLLPQ